MISLILRVPRGTEISDLVNRMIYLSKGSDFVGNILRDKPEESYPFIDVNDSQTVLADGVEITECKKAEILLRRYKLLSKYARDIILFVRSDGKIIEANDSAVKAYGYSRDELLSIGIYDLRAHETRPMVEFQMNQANHDGILFETIHQRKDGSIFYVEVNSQATIIGNERVLLSVIRDITERKRTEKQLEYLALHDSLTKVYNRAYFEEEMGRFEGGGCDPTSIILCDVDGLKLVNDTFGHKSGDNLLKAAARVINESCRSGDIVARIGGDEFAILLPKCDEGTVKYACDRVRFFLSKYNSTNPEIPLSVSIGCATKSDASIKLNDIFKEADDKMYREKLHRSQSTHSDIVQTLMKALEARDYITEGHGERLQNLVEKLALAIELPEYRINDLRLFAQFHDIGKVGIPDQILFKPGPLTVEESNEMHRHCEIGYRIAMSSSNLIPIAEWILKHHEWWNGNGYPLSLKGEEIPLECRILAIVDAYDAMTNDRPYRKAMTHEKAVIELRRCAETQFDPLLVDIFNTLLCYDKELLRQPQPNPNTTD